SALSPLLNPARAARRPDRPSTALPPTDLIRSPAFNPAFAAGVFSITSRISAPPFPSSVATWTPSVPVPGGGEGPPPAAAATPPGKLNGPNAISPLNGSPSIARSLSRCTCDNTASTFLLAILLNSCSVLV